MACSEERMQILTMLKEGKISVEEAARLLEAVESGTRSVDASSAADHIVIKVTEHNVERAHVSIPLHLARIAWKFIPKDALQVDIDFNAIFTSIQAGARGKLLEIDQPDEKQKVEIFLE